MKEITVAFLIILLVSSTIQQNLFEYELDSKHWINDKKINSRRDTDRLPKTIHPETYNITLALKLEGHFNFSGYTEIKAKVTSKTNKIVLHYEKLYLQQYHVYTNDTKIQVRYAKYIRETQMFTMYLQTHLLPGTKITITFEYEGTLSDDLLGFYKSSYYNSEGKQRWLATTQFQSLFARRAFPCFDEPEFKAKFNLFIRRPKNYIALTNMPKYSSQERSNSVLDAFEESPLMPSYLVAIVISDFELLSSNKSNVRIWSKPDSINNGAYALEFGSKVVDFLGTLFNYTNPVPKTDMVAVPDFLNGAMENWGLITYRETRLLYDENETPDNAKQSIAAVIAHEFTHMWFGNLVTPKWWDIYWLSEGFAGYFQYIATAKIEPSSKMDEQFVIDNVQSTLLEESSKNIYPISYSKGSSVIRMMEQSFGSDIFYAALREYIAKNKYGNVDTDNLWDALQNQVNKCNFELNATIKTIMNNWVTQPGYPLLYVHVTKNQIFLNQSRFHLYEINNTETDTNWYIPITYASAKNPNFTSAVTNRWINQNIAIQLQNATDDWIIFNILSAGFYRVNYDKNSWYRIIKTLNSEHFEDIHELNRAAIIDDVLNLARAELIDYNIALDSLRYIARETNYLPLKAAFNGLTFLTRKFVGQNEYGLYANYILRLLKNIHKKVGFNDKKNDDRLTILLRQEINSLTCHFGHEMCISNSKTYFNNWKNCTSKKVPKNQREVVYRTAIKEGSVEDWQFLWNQYLLSKDVNERITILKSLGYSRNTDILEKYLFSAMTNFDEKHQIRKHDSMIPFYIVSTSGVFGANYMLKFLIKHRSLLTKYYGSGNIIINLACQSSRSFNTQSQINNFKKYIYSIEFQDIREALKKCLDSTENELQWYNRNSYKIIKWLKNNSQ